MKIAGLIVGILLMVFSGIVFIICLALPSMTRKVSFEESLAGLIPSALFFVIGLVITLISAVFVLKSRNNAAHVSGEESVAKP